jgi:hypothetical protein
LPTPHQAAIVRRHGQIGQKLQADRACQRIDGGKVADSAMRCVGLEGAVEVAVALAGELMVVVEGSVDDQSGVVAQDSG